MRKIRRERRKKKEVCNQACLETRCGFARMSSRWQFAVSRPPLGEPKVGVRTPRDGA